jgi:hypothetical protein
MKGVSMKYTYETAPRDVVLWACAYYTNNTEKGMALKKLPTQGKIINKNSTRWYDLFHEVNKKGEIKSTHVYANSRLYADTKEECIEIYNNLVDAQIEVLEGLIINCQNERKRL